ncbi:MAG: protein-L-isoaspartate O-methyltransferase [Hyphomonadaceae bacterium]|nr:protein-L-isoaspartate O-methyltransferase [Hyphomonadaceae bacterium]
MATLSAPRGARICPRMNLARARDAMVESQVRPSDVTDPALVGAMRTLPRERFAPAHLKPLAYADLELEVAPGRFLLRPRDIGKLIQALAPKAGTKALEIGGATGYGAALLAACGAAATTLDLDPELSFAAGAALQGAGIVGVEAVSGPLAAGWPAKAPYDSILVNGAVEMVPAAWIEQLAPGGRLGVVVRDGRAGRARLYTRTGEASAYREIFDTMPPVLPGLAAARGFAF